MILVTGGTGLVGSHLLFDLANKGLPVRALRRKESHAGEVKNIFAHYSNKADELFSRIEWAEGDLLDSFSLSDALEGITEVYHCAALVSMDPSEGENMIYTNVTGTANLVNLSLEKKIRKFCYVSSVATLGVEKEREITEETAWNEESNSSAYAISKFLAENEVWRASQEGLNVVIVNPSIIIGPGNPNRSSGLIFKAAQNGLRWYSNGGMGYVDVRDVAKCMMALMESEIRDQKFIVSAENLSFKYFMELVFSSLSKPLPNKKAGRFILALAWRLAKIKSILTGNRPALTRDIARNAVTRLSYSGKKAQQALGVQFIPVSEAVKNAAKHFLQTPGAK